jgi:hypothetical protein
VSALLSRLWLLWRASRLVLCPRCGEPMEETGGKLVGLRCWPCIEHAIRGCAPHAHAIVAGRRAGLTGGRPRE